MTDGEHYSRLSVLIPIFNAEATIGTLIDHVFDVLAPHFENVELVLVNDGSRDSSHVVILEAIKRHPGRIRYLELARNFGEHNAVMCGLRHVTGDCVAIIDDDFQTPPEEIVRLVDKLRDGFDVVYSLYENKRHSKFRNIGSAFNNLVATILTGKPRHLYLSSFKVMNAFLVKTITLYQGPYPYIDTLILKSTGSIGQLVCRHDERRAGKSNYTFRRLVRLWLNMSIASSIMPLRIATLLGFITSILGLILAVFFTISWAVGGLLYDNPVPPGWASIVVSIAFFAGLQLCLLGVAGEYLGRLYMATSWTPQFVVRQTHGIEADPGVEEGHDTESNAGS